MVHVTIIVVKIKYFLPPFFIPFDTFNMYYLFQFRLQNRTSQGCSSTFGTALDNNNYVYVSRSIFLVHPPHAFVNKMTYLHKLFNSALSCSIGILNF